MDSNPRVAQSSDGHLFLVGGSNHAARLFDPENFPRIVPEERWRELMDARERFFRSEGIPWLMLLSPEKLSIYGDHLLRELIGEGFQTPGDSFRDHISADHVLYPKEFLRHQAGSYQVYPKTDSHWSNIGAFSTFQLLNSVLGIQVDYTAYMGLPDASLTYRGDLWSKDFPSIAPEEFVRKDIPPSVKVMYKNPVVSIKEKYNLTDEPGLHAGSHLVFLNSAAQKKERIILFGSSFSEYRLSCALLTFMFAYHYEESHFIWSTSLDLDYIQRHRPSLVVIEMPERFLPFCPEDDLCIEAFGAELANRWRDKLTCST